MAGLRAAAPCRPAPTPCTRRTIPANLRPGTAGPLLVLDVRGFSTPEGASQAGTEANVVSFGPRVREPQNGMSALPQKRTFALHQAAVRSFGLVTLNSTGRGEHSFDSAFPKFFGRLLQCSQVLGGELYQGGGARKF